MSIFLNLRTDGSMALFIDGDLQFDERDEKIYHEGLALPALCLASGRLAAAQKLSALIVGGGDGLAARELLKSQQVAKIDLVDYSAEVLDLAIKQLAHLNGMSLADERVTVHVQDAWQFVTDCIEQKAQYDLILIDLTVATDAAGAKFHSIDWYRLLSRLLAPQGILAANCVSPTDSPHAYWSIFNSMRTAGLASLPYRVTVPSFSQLGYGPDWGFILAAKAAIEVQEFDLWPPFPPETLTAEVFNNPTTVKNLFVFPAGFADLQPESQPGESGSNIFLHYLQSGKPYVTIDKGNWSALSADLAGLSIPLSDTGKRLLPQEIRHRLADKTAAFFPRGGQELFDDVLALMPALQPADTRSMITQFICDPAAFLEALDIKALVDKLVKRARELPVTIANELKLLQAKLVDWAGDYETLLDLGRRVVTTLAVVVILANFVFPDSAYGKGGHSGGYHGGGGHWGDRGGVGRNGGWNGHWGNNMGRYGGWGRANHWNRWGYGGWGGNNPYCYAAGPGYLGANFNNNQVPDSQGNQYPAAPYCVVQTYGTVPDQPWVPPAGSAGTSDQISVQAVPASTQVSANILKSAYKLGPDVDVLTNGTSVVPLTDNAYLIVNSKATDLIDQKSGQMIVSLYTEPGLLWHISKELKQQANGLKKAAQAKDIAGGAEDKDEQSELPTEVVQTPDQSTAPDKGPKIRDASDPRDETEAANLVTTAKLLDKAEQALGSASEKPPEASTPPVEGGFELFNSAWAEPSGKYVILKQSDGSLVYVDGHNWYSDQGTTKLSAPYPSTLKAVITAYLHNLTLDSNATKDSLADEQQEIQNHIDKLKEHLAKLQAGAVVFISPDSPSDLTGAGAAAGAKPPEQDIVQFGTKKIPRAEAIKRMEGLIARAQKRLDTVQTEINRLPTETEVVNKLLTGFKS
jgi:spermidine synthase